MSAVLKDVSVARRIASESVDAYVNEGNAFGLFVPGTVGAFVTLEVDGHLGPAMASELYARIDVDNRNELRRRVWHARKVAAAAPAGGGVVGSAAELMGRGFDPIRWLIPGMLPEGLMLLAARPKVGKSWFALDVGLATATEGEVLGRPVEGGRVLYLALEDSDRRMHASLTKLGAGSRPGLERFEYATTWPRGTEGAAAIAQWIERHEDARLVVVDVFAKLRETVAGRDTGYTTDYQDVAMLKPSAGRAVTVLLVHHTRKQESDDALDSVSGTLGIGGAADGALILRRARGESEAELHLIGRDLEDEGQFAVRFDRATCRWQWVGEAWKVRISQERRDILRVLADGAATPAEIAKAIGKTSGAVRYLLHQMTSDGQVSKGMDGRYRIIEAQS